MIHVIGANHRHASLTTREQLAASSSLTEGRGAILLSTCNRVEVYLEDPPAVSEPCCFDSSAASLYHLHGPAAVTHLFRVAAGLDSLVLGEHEIVGQVKEALRQASAAGQVTPTLSRLFRHALRTGKRARRETAISSGPFSVGHCAARLAEGVLGSLEGRKLLLFGAGHVAHLTAKHMAAGQAGPICIYSRTFARAQELAHALGGKAVDRAGLMGALQECDIIVGCATAPHHLVGPRELGAALAARGGRPLVVVDLGVPRNVDPAAAGLPGLHLFNMDDLESVVAEHRGAREAEVVRVEAIVAEEVAAFERGQAERDAAAVIARLCEKAECLRQECLRQARPNGGETDPDYITNLLVRKLLHQPLIALRQAGAGDEVLAAAAEKLFGLEEDSPPDSSPAR